MNDIVQVISATKNFPGGITAVDDISIAVKQGEFVTLLGPSGCGKTTMLRMIAGFEFPTRGRILLAGEDVTDQPSYERAVNTVFQDYALFPHMTIQENVGYGLRVAGMPRSAINPVVEEYLALVGLLDKADARPANLSGGQKQRVALARALVRKPKVLLLDEPLSALDAKLRESMQVELKHLHQQSGITFIFVTHDQKEALVMSDRILVMQNGKIAQTGTPAELYDHPATSYVADFIGSSNKLYGKVVSSDNESVMLQIAGNRIEASTGSRRFFPDDAIVAMIRPEKVHLLSGDQTHFAGSALNILAGTVKELLFHGSSCRLRVDTGEKQLFEVDVQLQQGLNTADVTRPGSAIRLGIQRDCVSVFSDDEGRS